MEYTKKAITLAIDNGWKTPWLKTVLSEVTEKRISFYNQISGRNVRMLPQEIFLDPKFWQAHGKREGYIGDHVAYISTYLEIDANRIPYWEYLWNRFIHYVATERTAEEFFADLLAQK